MKYREYVIWGVPANKVEEELLVTKIKGNYITNKKDAEDLIPFLLHNHNCSNLRIQTIEF